MWTPDDIRARFFEAADIERRVVVKGMPGCGNGWPSYRYDKDDRDGWDDAARQDDLERWKGRKFTTSAEQSRWQEVVFEWRLLIPIERRDLVWDFAECRSRGWSFSKYCEDRGLVRMTAYRRIDRAMESLARRFTLEPRSLKPAAERWVLQVAGLQGIDGGKVENVAPKKGAPKHPPFRAEKHHDNLMTPEAVSAFQAHVSGHNDRMRRRRERAMRGVPSDRAVA